MNESAESVRESDDEVKERPWYQFPSVKLMPGFRGATVIEGEHGGEALVGEFYPWRQIYYSNKSMRLFDENFERVEIDGSKVMIQFIGGGTKIVYRLKSRAIKQWIECGLDPVEFEPTERSISGWYFEFGFVLLCLVGFSTYLTYQAMAKFSGSPPGFGWSMVLILLSPLYIFCLLAFRGNWLMRPRPQSFIRVALFPDGFIGESCAGHVEVKWDELQSKRFYYGTPCRVCYCTNQNDIYWICYPQDLRQYPACIHAGSRNRTILGADRNLVIQGLRLFGIGVFVGYLSQYVLLQFPNWVPNAPPFPPNIVNRIFWMMFMMPALLGVMFLYLAAKSAPKIRRRIHGLTKRYDRWKQDRAEASTKT